MHLIKFFPKTVAFFMVFMFLCATVSKFFELKKFYYQLGGGILGDLSWGDHFYFNVSLTLISGLAYIVENEK